MRGNGDMLARYAMDLREVRRKLRDAEAAQEAAEARVRRIEQERDRALAECSLLRDEADAASRTLMGMHDLYQSARRRELRAAERASVRAPFLVLADDDGEIDTPAGGRA